ncbi:MAG: DUF4331 domain-containing protein [Pseudomonadales bacterium]|nr:DUF4331 domain-containing protein [Pseudomonadales bacterium]
MYRLILIVASLFLFSNGHASDHYDGPITKKLRVTDISDFYSFPSPADNHRLVLILNVHPFAHFYNHFQERIEYEFFVNKATRTKSKLTVQEGVTIRCSFDTPKAHNSHIAHCHTNNGLKASATYDVLNDQSQNDFQLFSGQRSDPFFFNWNYAESLGKGVIPSGKHENMTNYLNVLSIIIEIDVRKLFDTPVDLLVTAAQVTDGSKNKRTLTIYDRIGKAEITNGLLGDSNRDELRDLYNSEKTFSVNTKNMQRYKQRLLRRISQYDAIDEIEHWDKASLNALVDLMLKDYLIVDLSKDCNKSSFFEIERSLLTSTVHQTCGGRKINDDIVDIMFTYYVNRNQGEVIGDDAHEPYKAPKEIFPYLRKPDKGIRTFLKTFVARLLDFTL